MSRLSVVPAEKDGEPMPSSDAAHTPEVVRAKQKIKPRKRKRNEQGA